MITNLISFLYAIRVEMVRKSGNSYVFLYDENFYIFKKTDVTEEYVAYIYNFINDMDSLYHRVIKNKNNKYVSLYNNERYILMMIKFNTNRMLLLDDIYANGYHHITYVKKDHFTWPKLWKNKIDQVNYLIDNISLDLNSLAIVNYYLALAELSIALLTQIKMDYIPLSLCHNRINKNADLYDYYSVTGLVIDHFTRDIGEYIKNYIYSNNEIDLDKFKSIWQLSIDEKYLLLARLIFPSHFFDIFDNYVLNQKDFQDFYKEFLYHERFENNLTHIINYLMQ